MEETWRRDSRRGGYGRIGHRAGCLRYACAGGAARTFGKTALHGAPSLGQPGGGARGGLCIRRGQTLVGRRRPAGDRSGARHGTSGGCLGGGRAFLRPNERIPGRFARFVPRDSQYGGVHRAEHDFHQCGRCIAGAAGRNDGGLRRFGGGLPGARRTDDGRYGTLLVRDCLYPALHRGFGRRGGQDGPRPFAKHCRWCSRRYAGR